MAVNKLAQSLNRSARAFRCVIFDKRHAPESTILVFRIAAWVVVLSFLMKCLPLPWVFRFIAPWRRHQISPNSEEVQKSLERCVDRILRAGWFVFTPICWKRAAILHRFLGLNGIESRIVFGVRNGEEGQLLAHAWLESGGKPLLEMNTPDYRKIYSFPP
jgi:Transglutaminase-like superfamily